MMAVGWILQGLLLVFGIGAAFVNLHFAKEQQDRKKAWCFVVLAVLAATIGFSKELFTRWQASKEARLLESNAAMAGRLIAIDSQESPLSSAIEMGASGAILKSPRGTDVARVLQKYGVRLSVRNVRGQLVVSAKIRDAWGQEIAEIKNNEWKIEPSPNILDRNFSQMRLK